MTIRRIIVQALNLHEGEEDRKKTLESVRKNITFKGANLWILASAIIIASVGLNVNSTAVIIGAMLISPLMGPIVGAGFALGVYDFSLLKKSIENLAKATLVSLVVSTLYFTISPFKDVQSELLARTSPNIYDIIIAFFGGIVGVISITRAEKGNPIPGVAIATALMPPLCTAGYGLATGQWSFFLGAFYLYCINCVFIGVSTFLIIKYLEYPAVKQIDQALEKKVRIIIYVLTMVLLLPSSYLAYSLFKKQQFEKSVSAFIENEFDSNGYILIFKKTVFNARTKKIELAFLSKSFDKSELDRLQRIMNRNEHLRDTELVIRSDQDNRSKLSKEDVLTNLKNSENELSLRELKLATMEKELAKNNFDNRKLLNESKTLFPEIRSISVSNQVLATANDSTRNIVAVIYESGTRLRSSDQTKFKQWLNLRLNTKNVEIFEKP